MRRRAVRRSLTAHAFFLPFLLAFVIAVVAPLVYAIDLSLHQERMIGGTTFTGLDNYRKAIKDNLFHVGLGRVAVFFVIQVPLMLALALLAALAVDSGRLRAPGLFRVGMFIPYAVPGVVAALMWGYLYGDRFGLVGEVQDLLGVDLPDFLSRGWMPAAIGNVVTWSYVGYNMLILYAALRSIPDELYEAAEMDGAGAIRKAWSIKLPALRPALLLTTVFSVIGTFQLFNEPSVLQSLSPAVITTNYTPNMYAFSLAFDGGQFNYSAAIAVLLGLVTVVVAYVVQLVTARRERML
ncbi:carbohydrate ABC transporter permease [Embleya sp. MST-111070]|uniref:carbohydrate ABC transporter permease n=1 Tax=Embleya sp. MST-111070 TaxID=3398231 RepID=UPI003F741447